METGYTGNIRQTDHSSVLLKGSVQSHLRKRRVDETDLKDIRAVWQTGTPLGNDYFREEIERKLGSKIGQARRRRPCKRALTP
jgi:putative transposase